MQFKASLTWYDPEAAANSKNALINELKLTVEALSSSGAVVDTVSMDNGVDNVAVIYLDLDPGVTPSVRVTVETMKIFELDFVVRPQKYGLVFTTRALRPRTTSTQLLYTVEHNDC